jgi:L-ascorbate metabolism protein UlaG (beta-lactamase superfamily)
MRSIHLALAALAVGIIGLGSGSATAQTVKITPLGSHDGEFCRLDRAMILEDPDGTRVLYDAGRTVAGAEDPRLGKINAVLLSHVHGDHLGDRHIPAVNAGECGKPDFSVGDAPVSNSVKIVVAKKAKFIVGAEMASFFANKVKGVGGDPKQVQLARYGASRQVGGVTIATVPAVHSNGLNAAFIDHKDHAAALKASGLTAYIGPPSGYVLTFSNGLVAYLSGDTGVTAEQDLVVRQYYGAKLAVINIGGTFTTGPTEAAHVINEMVKPGSVIPSHANEVATEGGKLIAGTKTDVFIKALKVPAHLPLSGRTMEFDSGGKCVGGC